MKTGRGWSDTVTSPGTPGHRQLQEAGRSPSHNPGASGPALLRLDARLLEMGE